ncbi:MAG TPA: hypothetical protein ENH60_00285 [Pricia sp.]|nr:hypothetical protein [Pricia sp.]
MKKVDKVPKKYAVQWAMVQVKPETLIQIKTAHRADCAKKNEDISQREYIDDLVQVGLATRQKET